MPIRFNYDPVRAILFTTAEGLLTLADFKSHLDQESQAKKLGCPEIFDALAARTDLSPNEVRILVEEVRIRMNSTPFGPTAFVTANDVVFGMVRMFSILSELNKGPIIDVFRSLDDALNWLLTRAPAG